MFCRMHVWVRLTIWRKYGLWSHADDAAESGLFQRSTIRRCSSGSPSCRRWWIRCSRTSTRTCGSDRVAHHRFGRRCAARHVVCACDLVEASGEAQPIVGWWIKRSM